MRTYDPQYPLDTATATVQISVTRNENPPVFDQQLYQANISETTSIGVSVVRVNATDRDGVSWVLLIFISFSFLASFVTNFPQLFLSCQNTKTEILKMDESMLNYYANFKNQFAYSYYWNWLKILSMNLQDRVTYSRVGSQTIADTYFVLDEISGIISVRAPLTNDQGDRYSVRILCASSWFTQGDYVHVVIWRFLHLKCSLCYKSSWSITLHVKETLQNYIIAVTITETFVLSLHS